MTRLRDLPNPNGMLVGLQPSERHRVAPFGPAHRGVMARMVGHVKINCAIATRCDKLAESFLAMPHPSAFRCCSNFVQRG